MNKMIYLKRCVITGSVVLQLAVSSVMAANGAPAANGGVAAEGQATAEQSNVLRFRVDRYIAQGATLLTQAQLDKAVEPFIGSNKDFSDVQRALEAIEAAYAAHDFSAVQVTLPEQELTKGTVYFRVVEGVYGKVNVTGNKLRSETNVLNALPSIRTGGVPQAERVSGHLRLANNNPSRYLGVAFKASQTQAGVMDVDVNVVDAKPIAWGLTADNSGSPETGRFRSGIYWQHSNVFDADHVFFAQLKTSPTHVDRSAAMSVNYKVPLYGLGDTLEFSAGYSRVNALLGGNLDRYQGGGQLLGARYHYNFDRVAEWDNRITFGMDWRRFNHVRLSSFSQSLYNSVTVSPFSVEYAATGQYEKTALFASVNASVNVPSMNTGSRSDFERYDQVTFAVPDVVYQIRRFSGSVTHTLPQNIQVRAAMSGQHSTDLLVQGEQFRLGGADGVRGFSEGSEGGVRGVRGNLELYTPQAQWSGSTIKGLVFADAGRAFSYYGVRTSIASVGFGTRMSIKDKFALNADVARIVNDGYDPKQTVGDWRLHMNMSASF